LRLSELGQLTAIDEPLIKIRKHSGQISHEESGRRQKIDSRVAITSYWLRYYGFSDPVASDDAVFESFRSWVENRLNEESLFEFYTYIARAKANVAVYKSPSALIAAMGHIVSEPLFLLRFLRVRLFGESISRRLALEWMKKSKTCVAS
jgi:hypothetical protein